MVAIIERDTYVVVDGTKLINLSSHPMNIMTSNDDESHEVIMVPPSGEIARCAQGSEVVGHIGNKIIAISKQTYGEVKGLPEPEENTIYIVSRLVAAARPDRKDLVIPGPIFRDENNQVIGCVGLSVL